MKRKKRERKRKKKRRKKKKFQSFELKNNDENDISRL